MKRDFADVKETEDIAGILPKIEIEILKIIKLLLVTGTRFTLLNQAHSA